MKFLLAAVLAFAISIPGSSQTQAPAAAEVIRPALVKAAGEGKNVLLIFHASWCGWCRKMDASLNDPAIKSFIDRYYETIHLTVYESPGKTQLENPGALDFLQRHGGAEQGIPYWFVLDKEGNVLFDSQYSPGKNSGCPASAEEVSYFINVLQKTSSLNEEELHAIRKRFRENE